jgi:hypothetical protein
MEDSMASQCSLDSVAIVDFFPPVRTAKQAATNRIQRVVRQRQAQRNLHHWVTTGTAPALYRKFLSSETAK